MSYVALIFAVALVLPLYALFVEPFRMKLTARRISLPGLAHPFRILLISDLQLSSDIGFREKWILNRIRDWKFDLICVPGDVFDTRRGMLPAIQFLQRLSRCAPTYVTLGNWEYWSKADLADYRGQLQEIGIHVLVNESQIVECRGNKITLMGVDDPSQSRDRLEEALAGTEGAIPKILLAHAPAIFQRAAELGIDLVLAGHTHGGQVRFPVLGVLYLPPGCDRFDYGLYCRSQSVMVVTSGVGTSVLPLRFLCRPEVVLIDLEPSSS